LLNKNISTMLKIFSSSLLKVGLGASVIGTGIAITKFNEDFKTEVNASSAKLDPPEYPWSHRYPWQAFDHASIRRGFQVYKQVCSSCHSLDLVAYRNLVDNCYTQDEVKEIAANVDIEDGPDQEGYMFKRPGKLSDYMPRPYENENMARDANSGAYPPDLSCLVKGRFNGESYIFALLTGYKDAPHGITLPNGKYYNPYFAGGAIAMPQALIEGAIEFDDGTPSSISQMAKDVSTFLAWASEPTTDDRKRTGFKAMFLVLLMTVPTYYWKLRAFSPFKSRVIQWNKDVLHPPKKHH